MSMYTANINLETGIAYGYISANCLDSDLVNGLMDNGTDTAANEAFAEWKRDKAAELLASDPEIEDEDDAECATDDLSYEFWEHYQSDEPRVEGEHECVKYASSWLGGALNFFIFQSPVTTDCARLASPCVPNAGILDVLDGSVTSYDVPASWRRTDDNA